MRIQAITDNEDYVKTLVLHAETQEESDVLTNLFHKSILPQINQFWPKRVDDSSPEIFPQPAAWGQS